MSGQYQFGTPGKSSLQDKLNLAIALAFLAVFVGAACYPELDTSYAAAAQVTENVRDAVGVRESAGAVRTILVVENDDGQRLIAKSTLERYGYEVALADNGEQALALLRTSARPVALLLIGGTPLEAAVIRQLQSIRPGLPVLVSEPPRGKHKAGATVRVERPFSAVPLATAIREAMANK